MNAYYNAFIYKAAGDLAEMADATGDRAKAETYRVMAARIKTAFNRVLWRENAPGGPRYLDFITSDGREAAYFLDLCQWPAVAFGLASPEQARKIVATADARMAWLAAEYGYTGVASVTSLWPVAAGDMDTYGNEVWKKFGVYNNGGLCPAMTYWEVMGRIRAGDAAGAWRRLRLFGLHAQQTSWAGDNAANIKGELKGCDGEPYLADMVVAPAAVVHGILGIQLSWDRLEVHPAMPAGWQRAEADVLYRGRRYHVAVDHGKGDSPLKVEVRPLDQVCTVRPTWTMDFNLEKTPDGEAVTSNVEFAGHYCGTCGLKRTCDDGGAVGIWKFDETRRRRADSSPHQHHGAADEPGIVRGQPGHRPGSKCYRFDKSAAVTIDEDEDFRFGPEESFTLQCWLCTKERGFMRMISKSGYPAFEVYGYGLYLSDGILEAWFADADRHRVIARGSHKINDGQWHHAAAVIDRQTKRLLNLPQRPARHARRASRHDQSGGHFAGRADAGPVLADLGPRLWRPAGRGFDLPRRTPAGAVQSEGGLSVALRKARHPLSGPRELPEPAAQLAHAGHGHRTDHGGRSPRRPGHRHRRNVRRRLQDHRSASRRWTSATA